MAAPMAPAVLGLFVVSTVAAGHIGKRLHPPVVLGAAADDPQLGNGEPKVAAVVLDDPAEIVCHAFGQGPDDVPPRVFVAQVEQRSPGWWSLRPGSVHRASRA